MPKYSLFKITIFTAEEVWKIVPSSWMVIWNPPSPITAITSLSGSPILAPSAAGSAKPMVPSPPEVIFDLDLLKFIYLHATIWCWPTSVTRIELPSVFSFMDLITSAILNPPCCLLYSWSITLSNSILFNSLKLFTQETCFLFFTCGSISFRVCFTSPITANSTLTFLSTSAGSISKWIILACFAYDFRSPVTLSSNLIPIAINKSHWLVSTFGP